MDQLVGHDRATGRLAAGPRERQRHWARDVEDVTPLESTEHDLDNENVEQDGHEADTSSAAAASVSTSKKITKKKKAKVSDNTKDELQYIRLGMDSVAEALNNSNKLNLEIEELISQEVFKIDDISLESQVMVYRALTKDKELARAFLAHIGDRRCIWLRQEFGVEIFDV